MTRSFVILILCLSFLGVGLASDVDGLAGLAASRHLLATEADDDNSIGTIYENNCSMIYSRGVEIMHGSKGSRKTIYTLPGQNTTFSLKGSSCTGGTQSNPGYSIIDVDYPHLNGTITSFSMKLSFNSTRTGEWFLSDMTVSLACAQESKSNCTSLKDHKMTASFLKSYLGFSYHCTKPGMMTSANSTMAIYFNKLQVQAFGVKNRKFSHADDCIGFFSGGVWSSLFITLILTIILVYGISMISSINVMDRFDDPRGPGIQVNVNE